MYSTSIAAILTLAAIQVQAVKIMPLGDSITEITCWRAKIWDAMGEAGVSGDVDFVGSMDDNYANCATTNPNFDVNHEGHSGWTADDINKNWLAGWLQSTPAEVVQFMLGTNDITLGQTTDQIIDSYTGLVNTMRASNPNMKIIVDLLIPSAANNDKTNDLNSRIPAWVDSMQSDQSPIQIADCSENAGFTMDMLADGIHPNDAGDVLIAQQVGSLLIETVQSMTS